ncbi:class I SAM-dependent methyltransferase [Cohnella silvisoli]|uniref:Class I SAM-dependent methyltransferase n=1 Tax=Cohnella silvisoli TaxID=2873699 RepID=A0ABV1KPS6_9BACL|nr:class I SAM-dependent methyltransferase [Cohnella silvisoli]MCD9022319.1 class I SAM-dependent methyltransferase [Cohnella silvisoli]
MGFSNEWEQLYAEQAHISVWPWSDLVSYVMRYAEPVNQETKVLELGCGAGANIPFFKSLQVQYYAIEGSSTMVRKLNERFHDDSNLTIIEGDFTKDIPFDIKFDLIIDRCSLSANSTESIQNTIRLCEDRLTPSGKFIGIDWYSTEHSDYHQGDIVDAFTKTNIPTGHLANSGRVHFSDKDHIEDLFKQFNFLKLEHKVIREEVPQKNFTFASWNICVELKK